MLVPAKRARLALSLFRRAGRVTGTVCPTVARKVEHETAPGWLTRTVPRPPQPVRRDRPHRSRLLTAPDCSMAGRMRVPSLTWVRKPLALRRAVACFPGQSPTSTHLQTSLPPDAGLRDRGGGGRTTAGG